MPRAPSPQRVKARALYIASGRKTSLPKIAEKIGVPLKTVQTWKLRDDWDNKKGESEGKVKPSLSPSICEDTSSNPEDPKPKRKRGGQPGNRNGKGAPEGSQRALKHGAYSRIMVKYMDDEEAEIFLNEVQGDPLEELYLELRTLNTQEMRLQRRIANLRGTMGGEEKGLAVKGVEKMEVVVKFGAFKPENEDNDAPNQIQPPKNGEEIHGQKSISTRTSTESNFEKLKVLESQLISVQNQKIRVIMAIENIKQSRRQIEAMYEDHSNDHSSSIKAWLAAAAPSAEEVRSLHEEDLSDEEIIAKAQSE